MHSHEVGLLRKIKLNFKRFPHPNQPLNQSLLESAGVSKARLIADGMIGVTQVGAEAFNELSERLLSKFPDIARGIAVDTFNTELFSLLIAMYLDSNVASVAKEEVLELESRMSHWFSERVCSQTVLIPCAISPWRSRQFSIGPVKFSFFENVTLEDFSTDESLAEFNRGAFDDLLAEMKSERAHWLAAVEVSGCDRDRGIEVAEIAVDIALVAIQVGAPYLDTRNVSRLANRRGLTTKKTISFSNGRIFSGWTMKDAGLSIGEGMLDEILSKTQTVCEAIGKCASSLSLGDFRLRNLEQAWCDAAYWYHEGLAEKIDSIAVVKFVAAIEVFLRTESTKGSLGRMLAVMEVFFGLKPTDAINANTGLTAKEFARALIEGRSRVLHGTQSTLESRLGSSRNSLEYLAAALIRTGAVQLDFYANSPNPVDNIESFLEWMKLGRLKKLEGKSEAV